MASMSEVILKQLVEISSTLQCSLFEAASIYCEEHDLEQEAFVQILDRHVLDQIRNSAVQDRKVRKCIQEPTATLF
ncbi:late-transcription coactivator [Stenotrophomonas phage Moby]|uniref:Late-transcription coactivator n=1 Tax=Stenotrophomonas phage Moby TaxID=2601680 RepID=A0A5P8PMA8_9CAUD|nr:late-transcription coactivator [Stenotrophomonas phage Moby]QFR57812.1 late-transcription coactivator [Stenotrophomonas phage Moby]